MSNRSSNRSTLESGVDSNPSHQSAPLQNAKWRTWLLPICVLAPLLLFGFLAEDVATRETIRFDDPILLHLHARENLLLNTVMLAFTRLGGYPLLAFSPLLIAFLAWKKQRVRAEFLASAMVGTCALNVALKAAFQRTRPDLWLSIAPERDFSFPSGHSMLSSTFVLAILALTWNSRASSPVRWTATTVGVLFIIGVISSRLYLGVHYPSDVLAGFTLSFSLVSLLTGIFRRRLQGVLAVG